MRTSDEELALKVPILNKMVALKTMLQCSINHINLLRSLPCSFTKSGWVPNTVLVVGVLCNYSLDSCNNAFAKQLMVTEDGMEFRWHKAILGESSTLWALSETESIKTACSAKKALCTLESRNLFFMARPNLRLILASRCHIFYVSLNNFLLETETFSTTTRS